MNRRLLLLILSLFFISGCQDGEFTRLQEKAGVLCKEDVPDSRTGLCRVSLEKSPGKKILVKGELLNPEVRDQIFQMVRDAGYGVIDSLAVLPDTSRQVKTWGLVTVSVANLRAAPDHDAEMVSQAVMGTPLRILKQRGGWMFVQTPDHYLSWTNNSSVAEFTAEEMDTWKQAGRLLFTGMYGVITSDPVAAERISDLVAGCIVIGKINQEKLCRVELPDGRAGYADAGLFLDFNVWKGSAEANPENLMTTAKQFTGIPYMWGGTSSKALDCSGFTRTVWFLNGILLERDASQQFKYGEVIDAGKEWQNLMPGDLLFFGRKEPLRIIHVGIFTGNREVVHSSGQVGINSLDSTKSNFSRYLYSTYVGTKRVTALPSQFGYMKIKDHPWY